MQIDATIASEHMRMYGALRLHYDKFGTGIKIGTVQLPNFKNNYDMYAMYSKTEPTRSDEDILEAIRELAKKHAENGTFHNADNEYLDLMKEYISSVSPDRESILTNSLKEIFGNTKINLPKENKENSLSILQQTLQLIDKSKNKNVTISANKILSSSMYRIGDGCFDGNELKLADFYDNNGTIIASYSSVNGWGQLFTKEERGREQEILSTYNEAYNIVYNAQNAGQSKSFVNGNSFDVVG